MMAVARLRAAAYGRHLPGLATQLLQPEAIDFEEGTEVFIARSKLDGSLLGTLRTHVNALRELPLEASIELPERYRGARMVEAARLSVLGSTGASMVRNALFKAFFLYAHSQKVDWMMATGRRPIDRMYDGLMFADVMTPGEFYPMEHVSGVPHRVMSFVPADAQALWHAARHPLYRFVFETEHPDIDLSKARNVDAMQAGRFGKSPAQLLSEAKALVETQMQEALRSAPVQCSTFGAQISGDSPRTGSAASV